jgi:hypothetical protein
VYVGPCKGREQHLPRNRPDALGFVLSVGMSDPMGAATLGMIAILGRENLGREPPAAVCKFALELAWTP